MGASGAKRSARSGHGQSADQEVQHSLRRQHPLFAAAILASAAVVHAVLIRRRRRTTRRKSRKARRAPFGAPACNLCAGDGVSLDGAAQPATSHSWQTLLQQADAAPERSMDKWIDVPLPVELVNIKLPCSAVELLLHIFHPSSVFLCDWGTQQEVKDLAQQPWTMASGKGCLPWQREVVYSLPLKSRLGPEHAHNVETQELRTFYGNGWNVHVTTLTPNVPLGSTFHTATHYEARQLGHGVTELHISAELVFKRKAIGLLKGTITSAWQKGTHRTYEIKKELLREAFPEGRPGEVPENGGDVHHVREAEGHVAVKEANSKQLVTQKFWHPRSLVLLLFMCLLGLLVQLPLLPPGAAQQAQAAVAARLIELFGAVQQL